MNVPARWNINDHKGWNAWKKNNGRTIKGKDILQRFPNLFILIKLSNRVQRIITSAYWIFDDVCNRTSNRALINKGLVPRGIRPVCSQTSMGNHVNFDRIRFSVTWSSVSCSFEQGRLYYYNSRATNQSKTLIFVIEPVIFSGLWSCAIE